jgi:hypothetical protein
VPYNLPQIKLLDIGELAQRIDRMRQTCSDLDAAIGAAGLHRELLNQLKHDADEVYRTLLLEGLDRRKRPRAPGEASMLPRQSG